MALSACQVVGKLTEDNSPEAKRARRQKAKEDEQGNQREAALKKMTSSRTGFIGSKATTAKGGGGILRPKGGPGGPPPQPTSPVQKVIAEVRDAVVGPVDSSAAVARRNALLSTATRQRGLFTMTDSGGTFRPCGVAKRYTVRGSQEAVYLINERFRFAMRQIDRAVYIEVMGVINDAPGQGPGGPGATKDGAAAGAGAAPAQAGRRRPGPFIYVTKFLSMTAARPRDCVES